MRIRDLYTPGKTVLSLEVFPPKDGALPLPELAGLRPAFISVTVHASGDVDRTSAIAAEIQNEYEIPSMAHMTCVNSTRASARQSLALVRERGIENILALRGDPVEGAVSGYRYAEELIRDIPESFCVGAACYPEGHIESSDPEGDIDFLKRKQDAGALFFISQLFFDNAVFLRFAERAKAHGIHIPVSAGVMPVLSRKQIEKMIFLCGASLPARVVRLLYRFQNSAEDLRKAGIELAAEQARELCEAGADGVHIYTMNNPEVAQWIFSHC